MKEQVSWTKGICWRRKIKNKSWSFLECIEQVYQEVQALCHKNLILMKQNQFLLSLKMLISIEKIQRVVLMIGRKFQLKKEGSTNSMYYWLPHQKFIKEWSWWLQRNLHLHKMKSSISNYIRKYMLQSANKEIKTNAFAKTIKLKNNWLLNVWQYPSDIYFMILAFRFIPSIGVISSPSWKKIHEKLVFLSWKSTSGLLIGRQLRRKLREWVKCGKMDRLVTINILWKSMILLAEVLMTFLNITFFLGQLSTLTIKLLMIFLKIKITSETYLFLLENSVKVNGITSRKTMNVQKKNK